MQLKLPKKIGWILIIFSVTWFLLILVQGILSHNGYGLLGVDFELSGQFGDSFGALSALMASVAAIGAWAAVQDQRAALAKAKENEEKLAASAEKRDFEATFFNLLNTFTRLVEAIDVGRFAWRQTGKDAFGAFVEEIYKAKGKTDENFSNAYLLTFFKHQNDLAHYFRNLFNLIHFVKDSRPDDAYFYIRLLRSTLSEPELVILALNGLYHDQGEKYFKPLVEEFAILNNISENAKADFDLVKEYEETAFKSKFGRPSRNFDGDQNG